ncbi:UNVERIFIED_ORG: uncharacterized protein (DUF1330 family) [Rhizobium sophorae]|nr:uncharacterized protein (DUF1330 family) [Rhizobium leguminosarum]MDH6662766.1 uncharacterized protein (DUF1330 family) [Rhizobium sophorae]
MSAYLVVDLDIHDPEAIADYRSKALPLVAKAAAASLLSMTRRSNSKAGRRRIC